MSAKPEVTFEHNWVWPKKEQNKIKRQFFHSQQNERSLKEVCSATQGTRQVLDDIFCMFKLGI